MSHGIPKSKSKEQVLEKAELPSVITTLCKAQTRWAGHVPQMQDSKIPKYLTFGKLSQGKKTVGGQCKCYKDSLKVYPKDFNTDFATWKSKATDRLAWQSPTHKGAGHSEAQKMDIAKEKCRT